MMLIEIALIGLVYVLISVLLPGLFMLAALRRAQFLDQKEFSGNFVLASAIGAIWSALTFVVLYFARVFEYPFAGLYAKVFFDLCLITLISIILRPKQELRSVIASFWTKEAFMILAAGLVLGGWAFYHFPHVFDSGQLLWTQHVLWEQGGYRDALLSLPGATYYETSRLEPMIGFSGLIAPFGSIYIDHPLVTIAAGLKPFLLILLLSVCHYIVTMLELPSRALTTVLLVIAILANHFGLYGVLELGKDSIYGMLFCVAYLVVLGKTYDKVPGVEAAILFAAASLLGVITVPYMLIGLTLWLLFAAGLVQARAMMQPFLAINVITMPLVIASMLHKPLWIVLLMYFLIAAATMGLLSAKPSKQLYSIRVVTDRLLPILPLLFLAVSAALLPAMAEFPVWTNIDGSLVTEHRAPLDGRTGLIDLFFDGSLAQNVLVALAFLVIVFMGFSGRVSRSMIAVSATPFVVITAALLHLKLGLSVLTLFNLWDLIKDVPMWLGGVLFPVVSVSALASVILRENAVGPYMRAAIVCGVSLLVIGGTHENERRKYFYFSPTYYHGVAGSHNADFTIVADIIWEHLPNRTVFFAQDVYGSYFYNFQMYGARLARYTHSELKSDLTHLKKIGFAVPEEQIFHLAKYARHNGASLTYMASLGSGADAFLIMVFDGKGVVTLPDSPKIQGMVASIRSGAYDQESFENLDFHWAQRMLLVDVPMEGKVACVRLEACAATNDMHPKIITISGDVPISSSFDLGGSSLQNRKHVQITVRSDNGIGRLRFDANMPVTRFPNDARGISWAIFTPIHVEQGKACEL